MSTTRRHLQFFGRLDRYVASHFLSSYSTALLLVVGLFWIFDLAGNIEDYFEPMQDGSPIATSLVVRYYLLNLPYQFLQVAPFVTLLAGMFTVNRLLKKNEVVAVLGAGISAQRLLLPVFVGGVVASLAMFALRTWSASYIAPKREALHDILDKKRYERVYDSLWLNDLAGNVLRMGEFWPASEAAPARVVDFEASLRTSRGWAQVRAPRASWGGDRWLLEDGVRTVLDRQSETRSSEQIRELEGSGFSPGLALTLRRARDEPLELSFSEVQDVIRRDPDDVVYQTLWHYHLTFPLANVVLLLVGLSVMMRHERGRGGERMALGGLLCIFYFATDFVFRNLGFEGNLSPLFAAWIPILLFGSAGIVLLDGLRT